MLNRRGLAEAVVPLVAKADRHRRSLAVAAIDFDDFKGVNDTQGHACGDQVLVDAAAAWRTALGRTAIVSRIGGDEFVVVFRHGSVDDAERALAELRRRSAGSWSVGLAERAPQEPLEAALVRADRALYRAKPGG
ncbi:hypothetical protein GCM10010910_24690 [Microbacterium nanhaiense]|uniref:GGDEF domain-containing protein n=1 Tax=Microbacterium nanhaiense TaxID=1301026 RepID=A0ABQ2N7L8_9MICO|nr:GGDEF domain-containing protein [Microbacterium nanhaiense]GGO66072.1 hypothetical protein GCM10010910_24690 [Microbacterium nanhaiense]